MIFDAHAMFADNLPVDGTPTDLNTAALKPGPGEALRIVVSVEPSVTGATGLSLQDSDDGAAFSALFTWTGDPAGQTIELFVPTDARQHLRLNLAGTVANGNWTAGICLAGTQTNS
jgi:hypothetical protein